MTYGVLPTGFNRKPLAVILAEIQEQLVTEFGPDVIQTPQSPLGQINGLMADMIAELWEIAEATHQSYDVNQAEGVRLEQLGKMRLLRRADGETDEAFRYAITNQDRARIDIPDIVRAVAGIPGVTYVQVFVNDTREIDEHLLPPNSVCVAVLGGDEQEIADTIRRYIVPGISTYGNTAISTNSGGFCRSMLILRPIVVPIELTIRVRLRRDVRGCPPPSPVVVRDLLVQELMHGERSLINGDNITDYRLRSVIESAFPNVEFVSFTGQRKDGGDENISVGFIELISLSAEDVLVLQEA